MSLNQLGGGGSLETYTPKASYLADDHSGVANTDIVNVTEAGLFIGVGGNNTVVPVGTITSALEITIDGGTTLSIPLFLAGAITWSTVGIAAFLNVDGNTAGVMGNQLSDAFYLPFGIRYLISLQVSHNVTEASTSGTMTFGVLRGTTI